jgi:hypothetical protein
MLKKVYAKWGLLFFGSSLAALQLGQCIADWIQDALIFRAID